MCWSDFSGTDHDDEMDMDADDEYGSDIEMTVEELEELDRMEREALQGE